MTPCIIGPLYFFHRSSSSSDFSSPRNYLVADLLRSLQRAPCRPPPRSRRRIRYNSDGLACSPVRLNLDTSLDATGVHLLSTSSSSSSSTTDNANNVQDEVESTASDTHNTTSEQESARDSDVTVQSNASSWGVVLGNFPDIEPDSGYGTEQSWLILNSEGEEVNYSGEEDEAEDPEDNELLWYLRYDVDDNDDYYHLNDVEISHQNNDESSDDTLDHDSPFHHLFNRFSNIGEVDDTAAVAQGGNCESKDKDEAPVDSEPPLMQMLDDELEREGGLPYEHAGDDDVFLDGNETSKNTPKGDKLE